MSDNGYEGHINLFVPPDRLIGWAVHMTSPDAQKLGVLVRHQGRPVGFTFADKYRHDLERFGTGHYAFEVQCSERLPYEAILSGQVTVELVSGQTIVSALQFDQMTKNIVSALLIGRLLEDLNIYDSATLHATLNHALPHTAEPGASALQAAITILKNPLNITPFTKYEPGSISGVAFKTGMTSSDRAVVLGQDGHIFLIEGNNNVRSQYDKTYGQAEALEFARAWSGVIERRHAAVTAGGAEFLQIIIPEKVTLMREFLDGGMATPTASLAALEQRLSVSLGQKYISGISVLNQMPYGQAFRKVDSHITPPAAFAIFKEICARLHVPIVENVPFDQPVTVNGDLAKRMFGHECYEVCMTAREPHFKAGLKMVAHTPPPPGGYVGKSYVFRNELAPIRKKVILFGNSFFDNHVFQGSVSYWMAAWFEEYHFVFKPEMDIGYIEAEEPDVVICQTIERFLELVPSS
jgi:hypothetical protein